MNAVGLLKFAQDRRFECYDGSEESGSHWINLLDRPILGVDFHHTISTRCGACEPMDLRALAGGPPQKGVGEALKLLSQFFEIEIFTGYGKGFNKNAESNLKDYLTEHNIYFDKINTTKPSFMFQVDDRAIHHINWQDTIMEVCVRAASLREPGSEL